MAATSLAMFSLINSISVFLLFFFFVIMQNNEEIMPLASVFSGGFCAPFESHTQ